MYEEDPGDEVARDQPFLRLVLVSIYQTDVTSFSKMEEVLNGYVTNPNPTPTLTPNRNSNPNQINKKIQKETTLKTDQMT